MDNKTLHRLLRWLPSDVIRHLVPRTHPDKRRPTDSIPPVVVSGYSYKALDGTTTLCRLPPGEHTVGGKLIRVLPSALASIVLGDARVVTWDALNALVVKAYQARNEATAGLTRPLSPVRVVARVHAGVTTCTLTYEHRKPCGKIGRSSVVCRLPRGQALPLRLHFATGGHACTRDNKEVTPTGPVDVVVREIFEEPPAQLRKRRPSTPSNKSVKRAAL